VTLSLPPATTYKEIRFTIKAVDITNTITISPNGSDNIEGANSSITLTVLNEVVVLQNSGAEWLKVGGFGSDGNVKTIYSDNDTVTGDREIELDGYTVGFLGGGVGIGTATPQADLEIVGSGTVLKTTGGSSHFDFNGRDMMYLDFTGGNNNLHPFYIDYVYNNSFTGTDITGDASAGNATIIKIEASVDDSNPLLGTNKLVGWTASVQGSINDSENARLYGGDLGGGAMNTGSNGNITNGGAGVGIRLVPSVNSYIPYSTGIEIFSQESATNSYGYQTGLKLGNSSSTKVFKNGITILDQVVQSGIFVANNNQNGGRLLYTNTGTWSTILDLDAESTGAAINFKGGAKFKATGSNASQLNLDGNLVVETPHSIKIEDLSSQTSLTPDNLVFSISGQLYRKDFADIPVNVFGGVANTRGIYYNDLVTGLLRVDTDFIYDGATKRMGLGFTNAPLYQFHQRLNTDDLAAMVIEKDYQGTTNTSSKFNLVLWGRDHDNGYSEHSSGIGFGTRGDLVAVNGDDVRAGIFYRQNGILSFHTRSGNLANGEGERVTILNNGNVGFGITTPSQTVHVNGSMRLTGAFYDSNNSAGTANQILSSTATGTDWIDVQDPAAGMDAVVSNRSYIDNTAALLDLSSGQVYYNTTSNAFVVLP
jgi:hypothetical protein